MNKLIEIKNLNKTFHVKMENGIGKKAKVHAVNGVNLDIFQNETLGIVGESGCGKSTLARLMVRLIPPTSGEIFFDGEEVTTLSKNALKEKRRQMQMIFQDPYESLNTRLKIKTTMREPFKIHGLYHRGTDQEIMDLLETVGLSKEHLNRYPHEFSGGQRQRIGIARALSLNPKFIVADEPVASLDVSIQAQILNLLQRIREERKFTMAFIAHDLAVIQYISTRVAVMYLGKIVELAKTDLLFTETFHPYTKGLIAAIPLPNPKHIYQESEQIQGEIPSAINMPEGCAFHPRCRYAMPICKTETPELKMISEGHYVACHLSEKSLI